MSKDRRTPFWVPFAERYFASDQPVSNPGRGPFFIAVSLLHDRRGGALDELDESDVLPQYTRL